MTMNAFGLTSLPLLRTRGGRGSIYRFPQIITSEDRVLKDIQRGGFPLFRHEGCEPTPAGTSVHAYLEKILGQPLAELLGSHRHTALRL